MATSPRSIVKFSQQPRRCWAVAGVLFGILMAGCVDNRSATPVDVVEDTRSEAMASTWEQVDLTQPPARCDALCLRESLPLTGDCLRWSVWTDGETSKVAHRYPEGFRPRGHVGVLTVYLGFHVYECSRVTLGNMTFSDVRFGLARLAGWPEAEPYGTNAAYEHLLVELFSDSPALVAEWRARGFDARRASITVDFFGSGNSVVEVVEEGTFRYVADLYGTYDGGSHVGGEEDRYHFPGEQHRWLHLSSEEAYFAEMLAGTINAEGGVLGEALIGGMGFGHAEGQFVPVTVALRPWGPGA